MDFNARAAWLYMDAPASQDVINKARKYGIHVIYVDPHSKNLEVVVNTLRAAGFIVGAYFVNNWHPMMTGRQFGEWVAQICNWPQFHKPPHAESPPIMLDLETKLDKQWAADAINRYRQFQPARPTSYTNEPFQGPNCPWPALRRWGIHVYPQVYYGDMRLADAAGVVLEVARYMGDPNMVHPFYAGEHYGADQRDGCYFTLERMPD